DAALARRVDVPLRLERPQEIRRADLRGLVSAPVHREARERRHRTTCCLAAADAAGPHDRAAHRWQGLLCDRLIDARVEPGDAAISQLDADVDATAVQGIRVAAAPLVTPSPSPRSGASRRRPEGLP